MNPALHTDLAHLRLRCASARVLVVGDSMLDRYWIGSVDRISPEAPVPVLQVSKEEERAGGAANVALSVRALGAQATLLSVVGADDAGRRLQILLDKEGVVPLLTIDPSIRTTVKLRAIGRAQQLLRIDFEDRPTHELLAGLMDTFVAQLARHDAVLFSDYGKGGLAHVGKMIELTRAAGKPVLVDPKGRDYSRYRGATVVTPNRAELMQVVGNWADEAELEHKAQTLRRDLDLQALLLTRSEEGMSLFVEPTTGGQGHLRISAQAREVFDVTGAGDTVIAVLATVMACGVPLVEAVPIANRAGGIVVGKFGTASVSLEELFV